jgi:hypothetical protein
MNNRGLIIGSSIVTGLVGLYTVLPIETKERVMNSVRGLTDQLPENIKAVLPSFLLSGTSVVEKEVHKTAETLLRVN